MKAKSRPRLALPLACALFLASAASPVSADDEIASLERRYEQALDLARQPIRTLETRYVEELEKLVARIQQSGDLEGALLVRDEIENFAVEKERDFSASPELARLREVYEESLARFEAEVLEKQADVARQTMQQLEDLRLSLTQAGELEQAQRADARLKELAEKWADQQPSSLMPGGAVREVNATVRADRNRANPVDTGVQLTAGERYQIVPNERDRWSGGGTKRNETCDFRGYPDSRVNWMRMFSRLGEAQPVPVDPEQVLTADEDAALYLYAEDSGPDDNTGRIRVQIVVNPGAAGR